MRIVIIGAGPVGLGAAYRLQELGHRDWALYERGEKLGGLASSHTDSAGFTYDIGGHVMFSHYKYFDALVEKMLGADHTRLLRESWIWMRDRWIPYPLQNNIRHLPAAELLECLDGLVDVQGADASSARDFGEWSELQFGAGITRHFMRPYNFKVWAHPLEMMSKDWIAERVAVVDLKRVLANIINERDDLSWGPNNMFKYPLHGGTGGLYGPFRPYVDAGLHLNREVVEVDVRSKTIRLADGSTDRYDFLISAAPIPELLRMIKPFPESAMAATRGLHNSHGLVVGVGIKGPCPSPKCWTYFPESSSPFYRVTFLSNYSPNIAPPGHFLLLTETSYSEHKPVSRSGIVDAVVDGLVATRLITDRQRADIVSTHVFDVEYFYPVPTLDRDGALDTIQTYLLDRGILSRGRFGAWKYEISNMDHSVMQGVEAVDWLLLDKAEETWRPPARHAVTVGGPAAVRQALAAAGG